MDEHEDPFEEIEMDLRSTPMWRLGFAGVVFLGLVGVLSFLHSCATPGPLPPFPPVPDISGPPLMAGRDGGIG